MPVDSDLLASLIDENSTKPLDFLLHLNNLIYPMLDVSIVNSPTPVNSPTTRGGVYFSDKFAYKIKGTVYDLSIIPHLSKTMLGPHTEFSEIKISTQIESGERRMNLSLFANLTNSIQKPFSIELNMILVKLVSN